MKNISEVKNLEGVRVLVRLDLNVPIEKGVIVDDFRIRKSLPLINYLKDKGARIVLMSHIETKENPTLKPVAEYFKKLGVECALEKSYRKAIDHKSQIVLLENLREHEGEKKNDSKFAKELASLGDIYINEGFSVSHRQHASVCAITEFIPSYAGIQFEEEIKHLSTAFKPDHPFLFVLGGAKFSTKLPLVEKFISIADRVFVGGALANDFFREQGKDIGSSMVSDEKLDLSSLVSHPKLLLPVDGISQGDAIMDAGMQTVELLRKEIEKINFYY